MVSICAFLLASIWTAQSGHLIAGNVKDPSGGVVRAAEVQVLAAGQRLVAAARTDDRGEFTVSISQPGTYLIEVRAAGFADLRTGLTVPLPEGQRLDLTTADSDARRDGVDSAEGKRFAHWRETRSANLIA